VRESARIAGEAVPTTDSLRARVLDRGGSDGETIVALLYRERGVWSPRTSRSPACARRSAGCAPTLARMARATPAAADHATKRPLVARQFSAQLIEPFLLFLHNGSMPRARVHGPADPAAGALVFEPIAPRPRTGRPSAEKKSRPRGRGTRWIEIFPPRLMPPIKTLARERNDVAQPPARDHPGRNPHAAELPGIYMFKGERGEVLYVGKAVNLNARVRQYFNKNGDGRYNVQWLMRHVRHIETIITATKKRRCC